MKRFISVLFVFFLTCALSAQIVWEDLSSSRIYSFLDELATLQVITVNSGLKPYSRKFIAEKLLEAENQQEKLNKRQIRELNMFLTAFALETGKPLPVKGDIFRKNASLNTTLSPLGVMYRDSVFRFVFSPVAGRSYDLKKGDYIYHNRGGGAALAYAGSTIGVYANVRDNYQKNAIYSRPNYLTTYEGGNYKINEGGRPGGDFSEMRGGITFNWKWGSAGLVKERNEWGDNHNGAAIISDRAPSYAQLKLQMSPAPWFDFNYFHGWLVSMVVDSSRSYYTSNGDFRRVYIPKYVAANMFSVKPFKHTCISFGNSIVYSDMNPHPAYLNPFMFYKSIDHTVNAYIDNQNSQMFLNLSIRNIKKLHLYSSVFIDEWSFARLKYKERRNFTSVKAGFSTHNLLLPNTSLTAEFTQTNPLTFKHRIPSITFATNTFGLGHYLVDNARDIFIQLNYKPTHHISLTAHWNLAQKGNDYPYISIPGQRLDTYPLLKDIIWQKEEAGLILNYQPFANVNVHAGYLWSYIKAQDSDGKTAQEYLDAFGPEFMQGKNHIIRAGLNIGF